MPVATATTVNENVACRLRGSHISGVPTSRAAPWIPDQVRQVAEGRGCLALTPTLSPREREFSGRSPIGVGEDEIGGRGRRNRGWVPGFPGTTRCVASLDRLTGEGTSPRTLSIVTPHPDAGPASMVGSGGTPMPGAGP